MLGNRFKRMLTAVLVISLFLSLISAGQSMAEERSTMTMKELYYSIWPEYDKSPEVLVIYTGTFVNDTGKTFDGELRYKIPKNADINMVCETENGMLCQRYIVEKDNPDYDVIVWKPSHPIEPGAEFPVMMEYYYKPFAAGSNPKAFTQTFRPAFPVNDLVVEVKAPKGASDFTLLPEAQYSQGDSKGFTNYYYQYKNVTEADVLTFDVSYVRESNKPSVTSNGGNQVAAQANYAQAGPANTTVIVLILVFILMLSVFLFLAVRNNKQTGKGKPARKQGKKQSKTGNSRSSKKIKDEKRKIRQMLLDGRISEETYKQLLEDLEE